MSLMKLHFLDARGTLTDIHDWLHNSLTKTHEQAIRLMPMRPLDVVVQRGTHVIPEHGHTGFSPKPGIVFITVDTNNPALLSNKNASLERMFAHELHHSVRWDATGYGSSLGEALVSEGLAGHFVQELFGGSLEPWEQLPIDEIRSYATSAEQEWDSTDYNHAVWFFGKGDLPRWLGYSMGFRLVEKFLSKHPHNQASKLAGAEARDFRSMLALL